MNPEFQRNVWLELTPTRLAVMPGVLFAIFAVVVLFNTRQGLPWHVGLAVVGDWVLLVLLVIWGCRLAADALLGEVGGRTWDVQRLSAIGPWSMTWGKLVGGTILVWYGAALCAPLMLVVTRGDVERLVEALLQGAWAQALALLMSLLVLRAAPSRVGAAITLVQIGAIVFAFVLGAGLGALLPEASPIGGITLTWFVWPVDIHWFYILSAAVFTGWTVVGCYRLMRVELRLTGFPWAWPLFTAFAAVYAVGLLLGGADAFLRIVPLPPDLANAAARFAAAVVALAIAVWLTLVGAVFEPKDLRRWSRWATAFRNRQWLLLLSRSPGFAFTALAAVVLAVFAVQWAGDLPRLPFIDSATFAPGAFAIALVLFMVRDLALIYLLTLGSRGVGMHILAIVLLSLWYGIGSLLLDLTHDQVWHPVVLPQFFGDPVFIVGPVMAQAVAAVTALAVRVSMMRRAIARPPQTLAAA